MGGGGANAYLEALGPDTPRSVVLHLEQHLRALLRDVLCGYLGTDLRAAADDVLLTSSEPIEIKATDTRQQKAPPPPPPPPAPEPVLAGDPGPEPGSQPVWPQEQLPDPLAPAATPPQERQQESAGVTQSADWDWDDDPDSYSAPV
jgi:hypothetical protein